MQNRSDSSQTGCVPFRCPFPCLVALMVCLMLAFLPARISADPLTGTWTLNLARSHYGPSAELRKRETFTCEPVGQALKCTIRSVRADGRALVGSFVAALDGKAYSAEGIPEVDQVSLRKIDEFVADATFSNKGKPVFGYRAIKSSDGRSLTFVSVDPVTRTVLGSLVVYDRQSGAAARLQ